MTIEEVDDLEFRAAQLSLALVGVASLANRDTTKTIDMNIHWEGFQALMSILAGEAKVVAQTIPRLAPRKPTLVRR